MSASGTFQELVHLVSVVNSTGIELSVVFPPLPPRYFYYYLMSKGYLVISCFIFSIGNLCFLFFFDILAGSLQFYLTFQKPFMSLPLLFCYFQIHLLLLYLYFLPSGCFEFILLLFWLVFFFKIFFF